ncbi:MAG: thermonuclease family protein [Candidatus Omnitrophica bacterium]|nr:thermonuclease family protein [Candidatus Omnitrophota bacterium]
MSVVIKANRFFRSVLFLIAVGGLLVSLLILPARQEPGNQSAELVRVARVVDGDTFKLADGRRVRLLGIDTPEMHESNKLLRDASRSGQDVEIIKGLGRKACEYVRPLIEGRKVRLEFDIEKIDKYGRLLAYVYLEDGRFLNRLIIANGYAAPLSIPPNIKHADEFKELFKAARKAHLGLWAED